MGSDEAPLAAKEEPEPEKPRRKLADVAPKDEDKVGQDVKPEDRGTDPKVEEYKPKAAKLQHKKEADESDSDSDDVLPEVQPAFQRNEVEAVDQKFRQEAVHVYGLDFLHTEHMNEIFGQFNHKYIEWINDSCANIIFKSGSSAKRALESLSYPKVGDAPWRRTPDILVNDDSPPVFLQMRLATQTDVKKGKKAIPTIMKEDARRVSNRRSRRLVGVPGRTYRDGMTTELLQEAGLIGNKRKAMEPPTEEEQAKRKQRTERFGACPAPEEGDSAAIEAQVAKVVRQGDRVVKENGIPVNEEEIARRKKREDRFAKNPEAAVAAA